MLQDRLLEGRKEFMKPLVEVLAKPLYKAGRTMGGLLGFSQRLFQACIVSAVLHVLLIRFATLVLINMSPVKHQGYESGVPVVDSLNNVYIEDATEYLAGRSNGVEMGPLQPCLANLR